MPKEESTPSKPEHIVFDLNINIKIESDEAALARLTAKLGKSTDGLEKAVKDNTPKDSPT